MCVIVAFMQNLSKQITFKRRITGGEPKLSQKKHSVVFVLTQEMADKDLNDLKELIDEDDMELKAVVKSSREIEAFKETLFCFFMEEHSLIYTFGGIGMESDDIVPEATSSLVDKRLPGLEGAIMYSLMEKGAYSIINRGVCGIFHSTVVINLPGKPVLIKEILNTITPLIKQGLYKIRIGK